MKKIKVEELRYPYAVHIINEQQHRTVKENAELAERNMGMNSWNKDYTYYLINGGFSRDSKAYENSKYTIVEFDEIDFGEVEVNSFMIHN